MKVLTTISSILWRDFLKKGRTHTGWICYFNKCEGTKMSTKVNSSEIDILTHTYMSIMYISTKVSDFITSYIKTYTIYEVVNLQDTNGIRISNSTRMYRICFCFLFFYLTFWRFYSFFFFESIWHLKHIRYIPFHYKPFSTPPNLTLCIQ